MDIKKRYKRIYEIKEDLNIGVCYSNVMMDINIEGIKKEEEKIKNIIQNIIENKYILIDKVYSPHENEYNNVLINIKKLIAIEKIMYEEDNDYSIINIYAEYEIENNEEIFRDAKKYNWNSYMHQKEKWLIEKEDIYDIREILYEEE